MKETVKPVILAVLVSAGLSVGATTSRTNTIKNASSNWADSSSYLDASFVPGSDPENYEDIVLIPKDAAVTLFGDDAASVAKFKNLKRVIPLSENSKLILDFDVDDELDVPITAYKYNQSSRDYLQGPIVKRGSGTVHLSAADSAVSAGDTTAGDYYTRIVIEEGALMLQQACSKPIMLVGPVEVAEDATFFLPNGTSSGSVMLRGLSGAGLVTNVESRTALNFCGSTSNLNLDFGGRIDGSFALSVSGNAQTLSGIDSHLVATSISLQNNATSGVTVPELSVASIGTQAKPASSSLGYIKYNGNSTDPMVTFFDYGGVLRYVGMGETVRRGFDIYRGNGNFAYIDAGTNGNLRFEGAWMRHYNTVGAQTLVLAGSNAVPCVVACGINDNAESSAATARGYPLNIAKEGSGTWRFDSTARTTFTSGISVNEGVLQYDSMAPKGVACSVGVATNLTDGTSILNTTQLAAKKVPYAIRLGAKVRGGALKDSGRFEYTGTEDFMVSDREIAVAGKGGLRNNGSATVKYSNVYGISDKDMTLYLDGTGTADNEVNNVSDGTGGGRLSVVKEGSGKWILSGTQSWSGELAVRGGELVVRNPTNYSWYGWTITSVGNPSVGQLYLAEFCLCDAQNNYLTQNRYDANGQFISHALSVVSNPVLGFGQAIITSPAVSAPFTTDKLFDNIGNNGRWLCTSAVPRQDDPNTWLTVKIRLPEGVSGAAGYDIANGTGRTGGGTCGNCASNYFIEASLDGFNWDRIKTVEMKFDKFNWSYGDYVYGVTADKKDVHTKCDSIDPGPKSLPNVLRNVSSYSISGGGKLTLEPGSAPITISDLTVDAEEGGSIDGFAFGSEGRLHVLNLGHGVTELPLSIANASGLENVSAWTLDVNGKAKPNWSIKAKDGKITLVKSGLVILFR